MYATSQARKNAPLSSEKATIILYIGARFIGPSGRRKRRRARASFFSSQPAQNPCRCSSAEERRSHTAKVGCSNQPTGTNPAVVQWPERLNVTQVTHVRLVPQGPIRSARKTSI